MFKRAGETHEDLVQRVKNFIWRNSKHVADKQYMFWRVHSYGIRHLVQEKSGEIVPLVGATEEVRQTLSKITDEEIDSLLQILQETT